MSLSLSLSEELRFVFFYIEDILDIFSYLIRLTRFFSFSEGSEPIKEGPVRGRGHSDTDPPGGPEKKRMAGKNKKNDKINVKVRPGQAARAQETSEQRKKRASERASEDYLISHASPL